MPRQRPEAQRPGRADSGPHHALAWDSAGGLAAATAARRNSVLPSASVLSTNSPTAPRTGRRRIPDQVGGIVVTLAQVLDQLADRGSLAQNVTPGHVIEPVRFDRSIVPGRRAPR